jgi:putative membrane protein
MKRTGVVAIALAAAVTIGCNRDDQTRADNRAADSPPVGTAGRADDNVSNDDRDFVKDIAIANMAEVELGKLVAERSQNADVKKFGQLMIDDHTSAGEKIKAIATQHNITMPTGLDDKHDDLRDKLSKLHGAEFDREYISAMLDGHEDVLKKLESRVDQDKLATWKAERTDRALGDKAEQRPDASTVFPEESNNPATMSINRWAAESYPVVHAHLQAAKKLDETVRKRTTD